MIKVIYIWLPIYSFSFDRNLKKEKDSVVLTMSEMFLGASIIF